MTGSVTASYIYDGDGNRVKETISGFTRVFIGNYYESDNGVVKKYYYAGATRVAETNGGVLYFLLGDHLGSTAITLDQNGNRVKLNPSNPDINTELRYYPYGGVRYNTGGQPTTYRFTGQRWDSGTALYFYGSRWYDPVIGRFLSADTVVPDEPTTALSVLTVNFANPEFIEEIGRENRNDQPKGLGMVSWYQEFAQTDRSKAAMSVSRDVTRMQGPANPQNLNRYAYVRNNPVKYTDPSGYWTFQISLGGMAFAFLGVRGEVSLAFDTEGNVGVLWSAGGGAVVAAGTSVGPGVGYTTAPTVDDLTGWAVQLGVGAGQGAGGTVEAQFMSGGRGMNLSGGPTLIEPFGVEVHGTADYSKMIWKSDLSTVGKGLLYGLEWLSQQLELIGGGTVFD